MLFLEGTAKELEAFQTEINNLKRFQCRQLGWCIYLWFSMISRQFMLNCVLCCVQVSCTMGVSTTSKYKPFPFFVDLGSKAWSSEHFIFVTLSRGEPVG